MVSQVLKDSIEHLKLSQQKKNSKIHAKTSINIIILTFPAVYKFSLVYRHYVIEETIFFFFLTPEAN